MRYVAVFFFMTSDALAHMGTLVVTCEMNAAPGREKVVIRQEFDGSFAAATLPVCGKSRMTTEVSEGKAIIACWLDRGTGVRAREHRVVLDLETGEMEVSETHDGTMIILDRGACVVKSTF